MGLQDVAFPTSRASFFTTFQKIVVEVKALGQSHVIKLWSGVSNGLLPVKYFCSTKPLLVSVKFNGDHKTATKMR